MRRSDFMFLNEMEKTREERTQGRPDLNMMDGYRTEWYKYVDEWAECNSEWR